MVRSEEFLKEYRRLYYIKNRERIKNKTKERYFNNLDESRAASRQRAAIDPDRNNKRAKEWRAKNLERARAAGRQRAARDSEKNSKRAREWRAENLEYARETCLEWRSENLEYAREYSRKAYAANKFRHREYRAKRRTRIKAQLGVVSPNIINTLFREQHGFCHNPYCMADLVFVKSFHLDHIMPLALGGMHEDANLQLLCSGCNLSKGAKHPDEWDAKRCATVTW